MMNVEKTVKKNSRWNTWCWIKKERKKIKSEPSGKILPPSAQMMFKQILGKSEIEYWTDYWNKALKKRKRTKMDKGWEKI